MSLTDQTPAPGVNIAALAGEAILQALAGRDPSSPFSTAAQLADAADRPRKNIHREINQLKTDCLVLDALPLSASALKGTGRPALAALDRAAGAGGGDLLRMLINRLLPNPLSPQQALDSEALILAEIEQLDRRDAPKEGAMAGYWSATRDIPK